MKAALWLLKVATFASTICIAGMSLWAESQGAKGFAGMYAVVAIVLWLNYTRMRG